MCYNIIVKRKGQAPKEEIKMKKINWNKIDVITYNCEGMTDESKAEVKKANDLLDAYEMRGETAKAAYIRRRLEDKKNYIMH